MRVGEPHSSSSNGGGMTQSAGLESGVTGRTPGDLRLAGLAGDMGATTFARGRETKVILGPPRSLFGKTCAVFLASRASEPSQIFRRSGAAPSRAAADLHAIAAKRAN